jgi:hypothetical protein
VSIFQTYQQTGIRPMSKADIDWIPLKIKDEFIDIRNLSNDSIAAFVRLRIEFFTNGQLPKGDDAIRRVTKLERSKRWDGIMRELKENLFTDDWRCPAWEELLRTTQGKVAARRRQTEPATAARAANRQPAPEVDPDYEPIPF